MASPWLFETLQAQQQIEVGEQQQQLRPERRTCRADGHICPGGGQPWSLRDREWLKTGKKGFLTAQQLVLPSHFKPEGAVKNSTLSVAIRKGSLFKSHYKLTHFQVRQML